MPVAAHPPSALAVDDDTADHDESQALLALGLRIRELRGAKRMTLAELSLKSRVSVGMLSHIERGQSSPSLKTLERIRLALDVPLASFFERPGARGAQQPAWLVRAPQRSALALDKLGLVKELLSPAGSSDLEVLMLVMEPGGGSGAEPWTRSGEKAGLVLEGRFELSIGDDTQVLEQGDSFQFDSRQPHTFRNVSDKVARVVWIIKSDEPG